jgi:hypothetical protein
MADSVTLQRTPTQTLILTHDRGDGVASLVSTLLGMALGSVAFVWMAWSTQGGLFAGIAVIALTLIALLGGRHVLYLVQVIRGLSYAFDPVSQTIRRNEQTIGAFAQVVAVEIYITYEDGDASGKNEYGVRLAFNTGQKVHLAGIKNRFELVYVAEEIAQVLGVTVHGKPRGTYVQQTSNLSE